MTGDLSILGSTFECECGRTHTVPVEAVVYEADAFRQLPRLMDAHTPGSDVCVVADVRTRRVAGVAVEEALANSARTVRAITLPDPPHGDPVCDEATRTWLEDALPPSYDVLVAVGSGVINDLCKWIATDSGIPYVAVATAASMNGYAAANIAPTIKGVKRVVEGTVPRIIVADPDVVRNAPHELTASGLGDVIAKPVSATDWRINHLLFGEYYCAYCVQLVRDLEPSYMGAPEALLDHQPQAVRALFMALVYSGISMTLADTSFPASGGEHLVSHVLDMKAMQEKRPHDYHGRQVGVGTIFASALYDRLLKLDAPEFRLLTEETDTAYWGDLTAVVEEEHAGKRQRAAQAVDRLREPGMWDQVRDIISESNVSADVIKDCLRRAGAAHTLDDIGCTRRRFIEAVRRCHQIRARYTVVDLARAGGVLPAAVEDIVDGFLLK